MSDFKSKKTNSGIELKKFYGKKLPGEYPFTSGIYPNMYLDKLWTMRQYAGFSSALKSNKRYQYLLGQGVSGLSVAFDLPTQTGYDSDDELSLGEVGKVGVPICTLEDMRILLNNIPLDKVSISMTINSTAIILLAFLIVVAEENDISMSQLRGTVQNDILKEYIARGTYIYPPKFSMKLVTDIFEFCNKEMPLWNTISISGYHIREAGSDAVQELAFTFSNAISYLDEAQQRKLDIKSITKRISFFFNSHNYFFEEVCKFRAARKIWSNIIKNRYGISDKKSQLCRFHTQTAGSSLQAQQIENNIVRTTMQATAAILGGTQSLHTNSRDEALALPTEESAKIALRTQQIVASESGITKTVDPMAGSHYLEELCDEIEEQTWAYLKKIDKMGGSLKAIEKGFFQAEIRQNAYRIKKEVDDSSRVLVGVNKFVDEVEAKQKLLRIDDSLGRKQEKAIKALRKSRDNKKTNNALSKLQAAADTDQNLMPFIVDSVKTYATTGEISNTLREVFGEYRPKEVF